MLIAPILVPFFAYYGQDIQQIFWLESLEALTVLIMEVPSGYLADRYGRVAVLRAGGVFWSLSWLLLLGVDNFAGLVVFELFGGLGAPCCLALTLPCCLIPSANSRRRDQAALTERYATSTLLAWWPRAQHH